MSSTTSATATGVKIGTTGNPRGRFTALLHEEVLAFERGDRALEQVRHAQFAAQRIPRTEWFEQSDELAAHVAALQEGVVDPWQRYARWVSEELARRNQRREAGDEHGGGASSAGCRAPCARSAMGSSACSRSRSSSLCSAPAAGSCRSPGR